MNRNKKTKNVKVNKAIDNIQNIELTHNLESANAINSNTNNNKQGSNSFK